MKKVILIIFGLVFGFILYIIGANYLSMVSKGTNIALQSSDGEWAKRELLMKGNDFEHLVVAFEAYKIHCKAPKATLQRISKKPPWYSLRHYYNNYQDPKWLVPYSKPFEHTKTGNYPTALMDHCSKAGYSEEVYSEARKRAQAYITGLKSKKKIVE